MKYSQILFALAKRIDDLQRDVSATHRGQSDVYYDRELSEIMSDLREKSKEVVEENDASA